MATITVTCRLSSTNPFSGYGVMASGGRWTYTGSADFGATLQTASDGRYASATPTGTYQDVEFANPGTIPGGATINSVTVHTISRMDAAGAACGVRIRCGDSGGLYDVPLAYDQNPVAGPYSTLASTVYVEYTKLLTTDPMRGGAWIVVNIFNTTFALEQAFAGGGVWEVDQHYIVIDYTLPTPPTIVTVTGAGGVVVGGALTRMLSAGSGAPSELHLNQWGLQGFTLDSDLEEHL